MYKKISFFIIITSTSICAQSWGVSVGNFSFFGSSNNCYNNSVYYSLSPVVTYMPQNVYMRPYQYIPSPQPVIVVPSPVYYNNTTVPYYNNRCYNRR